MDFTIEDDCYVNDKFIGTTVSKKITVNILNPDNSINLENKEIEAYAGINDEFIPFGNFIIQKPENQEAKEKTSFTGYDYMVKFNTLYKYSVTYPCKLSELFIDICSQVGLEAGNTDFTNNDYMILGNPFTNNEDCRTVLSNIAQLAGGFAKIGRDNKVYIKTLKNISNLLKVKDVNSMTVKELNLTPIYLLSGEKDNADEQLDGNNYFNDFSKNEQWGELNSLVLGLSNIEGENTSLDDKDSIQENGITEITIEDNYFLIDQIEREKVIEPLWNSLKGIKYLPFKTQYYGYPYLDSGDIIYIQDTKDIGYISYVFNHTFKFNGAFSGTIDTPAMTKVQTSYKNTFDIKTKFRRAERSINKINGEIKDIVEEIGDRTEKRTSITQDINGITQTVERIEKSAITSVVVEYALSDSTTTEPQGGWNTTAPEWQEGKYMWQRTVTTYEDKTVVTGKAVCISGATGQQGIPGTDGKDGTNGTNGKNGKDGTSNYIHIKYSSVANPTDSQITEIPNKYIGICVNTTVADPTTASSYIWSKFEGKDGTNGIDGKNGIDGSSTYVHFAYSTSADGKNNFSKTNFAGATYIGVLTDDVEEDSGDYTKYAWSLIKGDKGIGINKVETQYYLSTSKTTQTGGSWKTTQDTWKEGTYYWIRTKITYDNNEVEYTTPILNEDTNSLREAVTKIEKTADGLEVEVKKKLGITELGTQIEQNYEHVKVAWNQISEFIQMMIINNNASLAILDENKNVMMALDKKGQHFYKSDGTTVFGEMGVQTVDNNNYIAFSVESDYDTDTANGMAWGIKTKKDNKFHPILFIRNFNIGPENSDASFGELELNSSNLVLNGTGTGIKTGGVFINGDPTGFGLYFWDIENNESLLEIHPKNILNDASISILNNISFYRNLGGSNSLKLGNDENNRCLFTDDGSMYGKHLGLGSNVYLDEDGSFTGDITFYSIPTYQGNKIVYGQSGHKYFLNWTGSQLQFWVDTTNVGTLSDKRLKTEIQDIDDDFIKAIEEIEMKQFKVANRNGLISFGILAQDLIEIFKKYGKKPFDYEIVYETQYRTDDDTIYYAINYEQFLILKQKATDKKLKELQEKDKQKDEIIEDLIKRIETLEKEVNK